MKLLLYCTKAKPYLKLYHEYENPHYVLSNTNIKEWFKDYQVNGKIVAECDFEVEKMGLDTGKGLAFDSGFNKESQLELSELAKYVGNNYYYAIHIKNLHIFDNPRELSEYDKYEYEIFSRNGGCLGTEWKPVEKAPQNRMYCYEEGEKKVLISIKPEELCKILNGEKTVVVNKKVLKEMF